MLTPVVDGVLVHESAFCRSNAVVVEGRDGVLLIDAGIRGDEMLALADDLRALARPVLAGFSTHPHWDHLLWHPAFGAVPRFGTARCAEAVRAVLADPGWADRVTGAMPPELAGHVPLDLFGAITGLPAGTTRIPWDGPRVRIVEHEAHARGHAALVIEESRVLVAGDMLSDVLIPMLDLRAAEPVGAYLESLRLLESVSGGIERLVPGHGSVGTAAELRARIDLDRAYVHALRAGREPDDPRVGSTAPEGWEWVTDVAAQQRARLSGGDAGG